MQNGFCENFNGRMRDELLNELCSTTSITPGRRKLRLGRRLQQPTRPHSSLGYLTPAAYAANLTATCARLRNPDPLRRSLVAHPAPHGVTSAETHNRHWMKLQRQVSDTWED